MTVYTLIYFSSLLSIAIIIPCVLPFVNNKTGQIQNLSELRWEQIYRVCVQVRVSCATDTYLSSPESYWRQTLVSSPREICWCATSRLPLGIYQRRARNHYHHLAHQAEFLAPFPGTPSAKIGELHTTLYLRFFSLVSLPFSFYLCVFYQNLQKIVYLAISSPPCLDEHVRARCFAGIVSSRFPSKRCRKYEQGLGQNF